MGILDHLKHLIEDEINSGHHRRGHHYDDHHYDPGCDAEFGYQRPVPPPPRAPASPTAAPCSKCGRFNPSHVLFCQQCGQALAGDGANTTCANCGTELAADAKFCGQCGQPQG